MLNISDSIKKIINENPTLLWGVSNKLFNLSQLSRFIKPLVESRTKKPVQPSAILMNLSRAQRQINKTAPNPGQFKIEDITINSNLIILTFEKSKLAKRKINQIYNAIEEKNNYFCITEGANEITIIIDAKLKDLLKGVQSKKQYANISAVGLRFSEKYGEIPGLFYAVTQQLALQNINIVELCSTYTELIVYVAQNDTRLVFDTIFDQFSER